MMHSRLSKLQREKCKHKDNFDYHSGYQQALIDVEEELLLQDAYLAGIFDGEGSVYENPHIDPPNVRTYLKVANKDIPTLQLFMDRFGGTIHPHGSPDCYQWAVTGKAAQQMTEGLLPFVKIKKNKLKEAQKKNFGLLK